MKKSSGFKVNFFRFKRWSRKNYAVFAGLHKIISIGNISFDICEKSLQKSKRTLQNFIENNEHEKWFDKDEVEIITKINDLQMAVVTPTVTSTAVSVPELLNKNYITFKRLFLMTEQSLFNFKNDDEKNYSLFFVRLHFQRIFTK